MMRKIIKNTTKTFMLTSLVLTLTFSLFFSDAAFASLYGRGTYDSSVYSSGSSSSGGGSSSSGSSSTSSTGKKTTGSSTSQSTSSDSTQAATSDTTNSDATSDTSSNDTNYYDNGENSPKKSAGESSWIWWIVGIFSFAVVGFLIFVIAKRRKDKDQDFTSTNFS